MINFFSEDILFELENPNTVKEWITQTIQSENSLSGDINIIFCSDKYLLKINQDYLQHNFYTDIITFNYCDNFNINGDLFISIDTVNSNSKLYKTSFLHELYRVIIHGILHLLEYDDKSNNDKSEMKEKEDHYLESILHQ